MLTIEVPAILKHVNSGELNLSQLNLAQGAFRQAAKENKVKISKETKAKILEEIRGKSVDDSQVIVCTRLDIKAKSKTKTKRQADGSVRVEQTFTKDQWLRIERAQQLLSHSVPSNDLTDLVVSMCERVIAHKDKSLPKKPRAINSGDAKTVTKKQIQTDTTKSTLEKQIPSGIFKQAKTDELPPDVSKQSTTDQRPSGIPETLPRNRRPTSVSNFQKRSSIKASVQREVFARDRCCQHRHPSNGRVCGSYWQLQLDHIKPVWAGGTEEKENLRVPCGVHNRQQYRWQAGLAKHRSR